MSQKKEYITVGIFDDNEVVIEGLKNYLENDLKYPVKIVFTASTQESFFSNLELFNPHFLVVDIVADNVFGLELFEKIIEKDKNASIIAYSNIKSKQIIKNLLSIGISAYIPKTEPLWLFNEAFNKIIFEKQVFVPPYFSNLLHINKKEKPIAITDTEKKVTLLLVEGLSSKEIAEKLFISVNTVNFHKKNLFMKFKVNNIAAFVKEVISQNYS